MDDRERIARAMCGEHWTVMTRYQREQYLKRADAVLAALGDRLLPELPDAIDYFDGHIQDGVVSIRLIYSEYNDRIGSFRRQSLDGTGPTLAAAIRDAVGEAEREGDDAQG